MLRRNGLVIKPWSQSIGPVRESVVGKICDRGRSWAESERERLRESYGWWEWWLDRQLSINRQVRDRGTGMRLTERTRKLIPWTRWGITKGTISYTLRGWCWWSSEGNQRWRASANMEVGWLWRHCKWVRGVCMQCVQLFWASEDSVRQEWCDRI